jgi:citronellol/citronellal dehydrogenase
VTDFSVYSPNATGPLAADFFVPDEVFAKTDTKLGGVVS